MWILATVLGILLFFVILLSVPVDLIFCLEKEADFKSRVRVGWLFGLVGKGISVKEKKPEKEEKKKGNIKPVIAMLKTRGFPQKLLRFFRDVFQHLNVHELKLYFRIGLGDPAETGMLFAAVGPAMVYTRSLTSLDIQIEPDFVQEKLRGYCKGDMRALPIQFVKPLIFLVFLPTTIRAIKTMVAAR